MLADSTIYAYYEDSHIYKVTQDGAKKFNSAEYDEDEEAWVLRTRKWSAYAISDVKLKTVGLLTSSSTSNPDDGDGPTNGDTGTKYNLDTGRSFTLIHFLPL